MPLNLLMNRDRLEEWNKNIKTYEFINNEVEKYTGIL